MTELIWNYTLALHLALLALAWAGHRRGMVL